jgi:hypothetical protein
MHIIRRIQSPDGFVIGATLIVTIEVLTYPASCSFENRKLFLSTHLVQPFLGHASLATTGIYMQLTGPITKEIALRIPTAADVAEKKRKERTIKESRAEYAADLEYWTEFVENVLEWPRRGRS